MKEKRCLIIGSSGQLGSALIKEFRERKCYTVIEAVRMPTGSQRFIDLRKSESIVKVIHETKPDWILISGAFCHVDRAEQEQEECFSVNVEGPKTIAQYAKDKSIVVVYYSSDSVFDGQKSAYDEADPVSPLNIYSKSKVAGESLIRSILPDHHIIIRTAWLYGPDKNRRNFIFRLVQTLQEGEKMAVPSDQWGSPTYTGDLAKVTRVFLEREVCGTYHAVGSEYLTREAFARKVCDVFYLDQDGIIPTKTSELGQLATRSLEVRLNCQKLSTYGNCHFRTIDAGLNRLRALIS